MINFTSPVHVCRLCRRQPIAQRSEMTAPGAAFGSVECIVCGTSIKVTADNVSHAHEKFYFAPVSDPLIDRIESEAARRWNRLNSD